jgi:hypothetical protein
LAETGTAGGAPAFTLRTEQTEAFAMYDASQFATAMLALAFTATLVFTGELFTERRAQHDIVYARSQLLRPL